MTGRIGYLPVVLLLAALAVGSCTARADEDYTEFDLGGGDRRITGSDGTELTEVDLGDGYSSITGRDADGERVQCVRVCLDDECSTASVVCQ